MSQAKVKFINKDKSLFYPSLREQIDLYFKENNLSKSGGTQIIIKACLMLSIYIIPYLLILTNQFSPLTMLIFSVVIGIGISGVGMCVMHDANHSSFSENPTLNKIFGASMFLLGGSVYNWKQQHNIAHHTYTNLHQHDHDITGKPFLRLCPGEKKKKMHKFQHVYAFFLYGLMTFSFFIKDFKIILDALKQNEASKKYPKNELRKLIASKVIYFIFILALPMLLVDISFGQWFVGFFAMHFTAGFIMSVVFQLAHIVEGAHQPGLNETGNVDDSWAVHQISTTANFSGNSLVSYYIGGLDYQIEHHLFPTISHVHYSKLSVIVQRVAAEFNIPYNAKKSMLQAVVSHYKMLRMLGK